MNRVEFSRNIATSLTLGAWTEEKIEAALRRRLPAALEQMAPRIAADLITASPANYAPPVARVAEALRGLAAFERVFVHCRKKGIWPEPDQSLPTFSPIQALTHVDVPPLINSAALAEWLVVPVDRLEYLSDPGIRRGRCHRTPGVLGPRGRSVGSPAVDAMGVESGEVGRLRRCGAGAKCRKEERRRRIVVGGHVVVYHARRAEETDIRADSPDVEVPKAEGLPVPGELVRPAKAAEVT